jgi:hypothetical protein
VKKSDAVTEQRMWSAAATNYAAKRARESQPPLWLGARGRCKSKKKT